MKIVAHFFYEAEFHRDNEPKKSCIVRDQIILEVLEINTLEETFQLHSPCQGNVVDTIYWDRDSHRFFRSLEGQSVAEGDAFESRIFILSNSGHPVTDSDFRLYVHYDLQYYEGVREALSHDELAHYVAGNYRGETNNRDERLSELAQHAKRIARYKGKLLREIHTPYLKLTLDHDAKDASLVLYAPYMDDDTDVDEGAFPLSDRDALLKKYQQQGFTFSLENILFTSLNDDAIKATAAQKVKCHNLR